MKAVTYQGIKNVVVKDVPDPKIEKPDDMIIKVTSTAICGSDLHLIHGMIPNMQEDYIIGHEPMGIVEEVGPNVTKVKKGIVLLFLLTLPAGNAFIVKTIWKANVIILMIMVIWGRISDTRERLAVIQAGKLNIYVFPLPISLTLRFQKPVKNQMKNYPLSLTL